ncbi:hypothetical protein [Streptomyces graminilatus]|uniref:hypothetical protein n=1 Tax=Streptomyces graminilatus TaxID=1464070 RepID=UPI0006E2B006|nr:hypothetical protein [Streptomyces graminilatus]
MPVFFLPSTREEDELAAYLMQRRDEPCWLCKRETRKTCGGYMCWECQATKPIWAAHIDAISKAEYERKALAYVGPCLSCAKRLVAGGFECVTCRAEWTA